MRNSIHSYHLIVHFLLIVHKQLFMLSAYVIWWALKTNFPLLEDSISEIAKHYFNYS